MSTDVFERHEVKYLVDGPTRTRLMHRIGDRITPDEHGRSSILNLYLDTPDHRLVRRSLEKPAYKEKVRLRSYGMPGPDGMVFLELKKKYRQVVYKRRVELTNAAARTALAHPSLLVREGQIGRELAYAFDFYQGLSPVMYLSYDREAFYSTDDRDLRITFDDDVRWRTHDLDLDVAPSGEEVLARGGSILEVKAAGSMPLWLADTLNELAVFPTGFSKYGRAYQMMNGTKEALSA